LGIESAGPELWTPLGGPGTTACGWGGGGGGGGGWGGGNWHRMGATSAHTTSSQAPPRTETGCVGVRRLVAI